MDSSKRKVNGASAVAGDDVDDRALKRRKIPGDNTPSSKGENAETTKENGLKLLEIIKKTEDKSGRLIATDFLTLPNKRQLPQYYKMVKLPIALDTMEARLLRLEIPNLTALESLFKRMILNAREFNEKGSRIYDDAERLRKALSNFMTKHNPAYKTGNYVPAATPLPGEENLGQENAEEVVESDEEESETPAKRRGRPPKISSATASRKSATPAVSDGSKYGNVGFQGLNFQQAQEKIVEDMLDYKEVPDDDFAGFEPFVELPDRSLKDYYAVIPNPVSLIGLQKKVRGIRGRNAATGVSEFKTWATFEEETSFIWKNAWHYNEDGSAISALAKELQTFFYKKLKDAKQAVPEPAGPKIKLKLPEVTPRITLKIGPKGSPAGSPAPHTNGSSNNGAPVNGASRRNPFGGTHSTVTPMPSLDQLERARSMSGSAASPTLSNAAPVKSEEVNRNSPAISAGQTYRAPSLAASTHGLNDSGMPPPSTPSLPHSYTPSGFAQSFNHQSQYHAPNPAFESKWRQPGKDASDAMITNLSLATHPGLNISQHFRMDLPPSPTMAQQSITINLPSTHYYLQIKPTIAASLLERQYKLFVTSGTQRLHAMPTIPGHSVDPRHPLFEARLLPGVNRIEIELIAALPKNAPKPANGQDVEMEKITVFANLMR